MTRAERDAAILKRQIDLLGANEFEVEVSKPFLRVDVAGEPHVFYIPDGVHRVRIVQTGRDVKAVADDGELLESVEGFI